MNKNYFPKRILSIDPGTKFMGYADFYDDQLLDYGVKVYRPKSNIKLLLVDIENSIRRLLLEKKPTTVVLEKNRFSQITNNIRLTLAISRIKHIAKKNSIPVIEYAPNTIRSVINQDGNTTKEELARTITSYYPELKYYTRKPSKSNLQIFLNITDAVACGKTYIILNKKQNEQKT